MDLLINESIHRNFDATAVFRLHLDYVNYPFSMLFLAMLHSLLSGGIAKFDVIFCENRYKGLKVSNKSPSAEEIDCGAPVFTTGR